MNAKASAILLFVAVGVVGLSGAGAIGSAAALVLGNEVPIETPTTVQPAGDAPDPGAFTFEVREIDRGGSTRAEVTALVGNARERPATDVDVGVRVFAGGSTDPAVLDLQEAVGDLGARKATLVRRTVRVPIGAVRAVRKEGGVATVEVRVASAEATTVFRETRPVG